jgi:Chaperone of endosialidase
MKYIAICILSVLCGTAGVWGQNQSLPDISGKGTAGTIAKFTSRTTIGNSSIFQTPTGNVGVGTTSPGAELDVASNFPGGGSTVIVENINPNGDDAIDFHSAGAFVGNLGMITSEQPTRFFILHNSDFPAMPLTLAENGGNVGIGISNPTNILTIRQSAGVAIADGWATYSSRRWKTNIQPLVGALERIERLQGVTFSWKANGKQDFGLIAEEVAAVVPELITYDDNGKDPKAIDYSRLTTLLIEAVKEQQREINGLKEQLGKVAPPPGK